MSEFEKIMPLSEEMQIEAAALSHVGVETSNPDLIEQAKQMWRQSHLHILNEVLGAPPMQRGETMYEYMERMRQGHEKGEEPTE